jgi:hypothetical protein
MLPWIVFTRLIAQKLGCHEDIGQPNDPFHFSLMVRSSKVITRPWVSRIIRAHQRPGHPRRRFNNSWFASRSRLISPDSPKTCSLRLCNVSSTRSSSEVACTSSQDSSANSAALRFQLSDKRRSKVRIKPADEDLHQCYPHLAGHRVNRSCAPPSSPAISSSVRRSGTCTKPDNSALISRRWSVSS